jgi:uncharacterized protein YkwD
MSRIPRLRRREVVWAIAVIALAAAAPVVTRSREADAQGNLSFKLFLPFAWNTMSSGAPSATPVRTATPTVVVWPTAGATATATPTRLVWPSDTPPAPASATPTRTVPPTPTSGLPGWHQYVNYHRHLAKLPPVTENDEWSRGGQLHAKYMVKNNVIGHSESPSRPFYTPEGNEAAANGNVYLASASVGATHWYRTYRHAIDAWMTGPFHMLGVIDPRLRVSGFGEYEEDIGEWHRYGATLDVLRGRGDVPAGVSYPVFYPADGGTIPNLSYDGGEFPDPLAAPKCRAYTVPTGPPIALQLGTGQVTPKVKRTAFSDGSADLPHCWFDETTYGGSPGKEGLNMRDAIILMPKQPLDAGQRYSVTIEVNDQAYTWSFTADPDDRPVSAGNALVAPFPPALVPHD